MYLEYFHWQVVVAPRWLLILIFNLQRALLRFFSVPLMLRTLVAPWHRDQVSVRQGTISDYLMAVALNAVSRGVGCLVRLAVLMLWFIAELTFIPLALGSFLAFLLWPLLVLVLIAQGVSLLIT